MAARKTAKTAAPRMGRPPNEYTGPLGDLIAALGGLKQLAEAAGLEERSVRRYADGTRSPGGPTRKLFARIAQDHGLKPPFGEA